MQIYKPFCKSQVTTLLALNARVVCLHCIVAWENCCFQFLTKASNQTWDNCFVPRYGLTHCIDFCV